MNEMSLTEQLTYSTVLIHCTYSDGCKGSGTGFIMQLCNNKENKSSVPVLITNNHVVRNSVNTVFEFCKADSNGNPLDLETCICTYNGYDWIPHPDGNIDLCCLPLARIINEMNKNNVNVFYIPLTTDVIPNRVTLEDLSAMEEVVMFCYPEGYNDSYNHKPIIRRGITATHPKKDFEGRKEVLLDITCFNGSSGSPVFIFKHGLYSDDKGKLKEGYKVILLGVMYGYKYTNKQYQIKTEVSSVTQNYVNVPTPLNLGLVIKSECILQFEDIFSEENSNG